MSRVAVVTDSTCDLPADLAEALQLRVVPMSVRFGQREVISRVTMSDEAFYAELSASEDPPATSRPGTPWFEEAWADAADELAPAAVSLHVSSALSGTVDQARALAADAPLPVTVVDSRSVSGGLALQVLAAVRTAAAGGDVDDVVGAAQRVRAQAEVLIVADTSTHLRRAGRLSGAEAAIGTTLRVKPVLGVRDGRIELLDRVRTWSRAVARLVERAAAIAGDEPQHVVLAHALARDRGGQVLARLAAEVDVAESLEVVIGPLVGAHVGPGAVGVALAPASLT